MSQDSALPKLLQEYLDRSVGLDVVHAYVSWKLGEVEDELIYDVSMEIWQFQDGYLPEDELKSRLAVILAESRAASSLASD